MSLVRVLLEPKSPIYSGPHGHARKSGALVHSDVLHAALVCIAASAGQDIEPVRTLRLSSIFPCWRHVHFYPRPFLALPTSTETGDSAKRKRWKNVRLVSEGTLPRWLAGDATLTDHVHIIESGVALLDDELKGRAWPQDGMLCEDISAAVTIDRLTNAATPFERRHVRVNAAGGCGMYFLADLDKLTEPMFRDLVERLGEQGIGGERTVGFGHFAVLDITTQPSLSVGAQNRPADMFMSLSLYLPSRDEVAAGVLDGKAAYDTTLRGGWIHSAAGTPQRRRSLRMCVDGSVFPKVTDKPGEIRNCAPASFTAHPVWRSGLALPFWFTP